MGSHGIKDRVAIVGMGCTPLRRALGQGPRRPARRRHRTRRSPRPGVAKDDGRRLLARHRPGRHVAACSWLKPLQLEDKPVTRVENILRHRLRGAAPGRLRGRRRAPTTLAMAVGVEKVKDSGYQGLNAFPVPTDGTQRTLTAAAMFSMVAPAYAERYGVADGRAARPVLARIASKNHFNGARNPRAQFRTEMSVEQILKMPNVAGDLVGVRLRRRGRRRRRRDRVPGRGRPPVHRLAAVREGAVVRRRQRLGPHRPGLRLHDVPRDRRRARRTPTPRPASPTRPRAGHGRGPRLLHADRAGA